MVHLQFLILTPANRGFRALSIQVQSSINDLCPPPAGDFSDLPLTERQRRELEYYEEFSRLNFPKEVCFDAVSGNERRPWNPYWFLCESVKSHFHSGEQQLLDFGCGPGIYSLLFGKVGYQVSGFDISPSNVEIAHGLATKYDLTDRVNFTVGAGEHLDYEDEYFDAVVGIDILHHVDIENALRECLRVLKPGGLALFKEPVAVPVFDSLRNSALGRWLVPNGKSLERHITEDERKLTTKDLKLIQAISSEASMKRFRVFSRLDRFNKALARNGGPSTLEKLDERLLRVLPFLKHFGGDVVITLKK